MSPVPCSVPTLHEISLCENVFLRNCVTLAYGQTDIHTHTYHCDVEGIQQVKGQSCNQVNEEPGGAVMEADGAGIVHHLTRLAHIGGAEIQDDI